jgi:transcriptional regulator with XRE-family HTH domain
MEADTMPGRSAIPTRKGPIGIRELARRSGLSPSYVSYILSGKRQPSVRSSRKLAKATGVSLERFLESIKV